MFKSPVSRPPVSGRWGCGASQGGLLVMVLAPRLPARTPQDIVARLAVPVPRAAANNIQLIQNHGLSLVRISASPLPRLAATENFNRAYHTPCGPDLRQQQAPTAPQPSNSSLG